MSLLDTASLVITPNGTKASTLYSVVPSDGSGDMTVTRATTATRVNSAGLIESVASNVPRLDYSNGTCPSILVEPQRTNLFTWSEDFSDSSWNKINIASVTTGITDPANGTTGVRLASGVGLNGIVTKTLTTTIGTPYTVTIWIKGTANGTINLNHAGISLAPQNNISYTTQWQKFQYNFTADSIATEILLGAFFSWSAGQNIDFTFAQIEAGSYATSYIPTTSASVTRNADVISKTGISSLIGQTEGTIFVDFNRTSTNEGGLQLGNSDGPNDYLNSIILQWNVNGVYTNIFVGGATQFSNTSSSVTGRHKLAVVYKANDFALYIDGIQIATDTSGSIPSLAAIFLNHQNFALTGTNINTSAIWKTRLTNTQLQTLTTI